MESRAWHVFATYFAAVAGIFATTGVAIEVLRAVYPDVPEVTLVRTLPGLLAGSLAASTGLLLTLLLVVRPLDPVRFRLLPGWAPGSTLAIATLGLPALRPALRSLTVRLRAVAPAHRRPRRDQHRLHAADGAERDRDRPRRQRRRGRGVGRSLRRLRPVGQAHRATAADAGLSLAAPPAAGVR